MYHLESDNWIVGNLKYSLETWNSKLSEIWGLITKSPTEFRDGTIWTVITDINGALQAIGLAPGPVMGATLRSLEDWWIASDFKPTREELLARAQRRT